MIRWCGEFCEDGWKPVPRIDIQAELVVAPVEVLDEGVSNADYSCQAKPFEAAHRPQP